MTNNTGRSQAIYFAKNGGTEQNLILASGAQTWISVRPYGYWWTSCSIKVRADGAYGEGTVNIPNANGSQSFALKLRIRHPWGTANYNLKPL